MPRDLEDYEQAYSDSQFETVQAAYRKRMILELLERARPARVLEVGCGLDSLANHWAQAESFVIVEPARGFADRARAALTGRPDVRVVEAPLEAAGELGGPFDLIVVSALLHELVDCEPLLSVTRDLCDARTLVHVNVPNANSFHRLLAREMGLIKSVTEPSDLQVKLQQPKVFTLDTLTQLIGQYGFAVEESGSYFIKPFTHHQMQTLIDGGFLTTQMLEGFWGMAKHLPDLGSEIFVNVRLSS